VEHCKEEPPVEDARETSGVSPETKFLFTIVIPPPEKIVWREDGGKIMRFGGVNP